MKIRVQITFKDKNVTLKAPDGLTDEQVLTWVEEQEYVWDTYPDVEDIAYTKLA